MKFLSRYLIFLLLIGFILTPVFSLSTYEKDSINIYSKDISELLDFDYAGASKLAAEAYQKGEYETAARYYLELAQHDITNNGTIYNLACCYGLLGKDKLAADFLGIAYDTGFTNIEHIKNDPDFEKVRGKKVFDELVDSLEKNVAEKEDELGDTVLFDTKSYLKGRIKFPENYDPDKICVDPDDADPSCKTRCFDGIGVDIGDKETAGELHDKLSIVGADTLLETIDSIEQGNAPRIKQKGEITKAPKITKEFCHIDWKKDVVSIYNLVRGLSPFPRAFSFFKGDEFKICGAEISTMDLEKDKFAGEIISLNKDKIFVAAGNGILAITEVQPPNKRRMSVAEYLRGHLVALGEKFQ